MAKRSYEVTVSNVSYVTVLADSPEEAAKIVDQSLLNGDTGLVYENCTGWEVTDCEPGGEAGVVECKFCGDLTDAETAHLHEDEWVGDDCCWDERLRVTE